MVAHYFKIVFMGLIMALMFGCEPVDTGQNALPPIKGPYGNETNYEIFDTGYFPSGSNSIYWLDNNAVAFVSHEGGRFVYREDPSALPRLDVMVYDLEKNSVYLLSADYKDLYTQYRIVCKNVNAIYVEFDRKIFVGRVVNRDEKYTIVDLVPVPKNNLKVGAQDGCFFIDGSARLKIKKRIKYMPAIDARIEEGLKNGEGIFYYENQEKLIDFDFMNSAFSHYSTFLDSMVLGVVNRTDDSNGEYQRHLYFLYRNGRIEKTEFPHRVANFGYSKAGAVGSYRDDRNNDLDPNDRGYFLYDAKGGKKMLIKGWVRSASISPDGCRSAVSHVSDIRRSGNVRNNSRTLKIIELCKG